ncbi:MULTISPECIES: 2-succinyl-5-enolpyruvyl-6-hydroxy-3-cyclohexene-1-carboxylic-acid synthase [unclassified Corynebacterium]|uniref:2-succinyl-5-enolpyruvyl-6-hydroxy-3- cyclohexene-1-carboxylic-acid synthase n=1 Tax=unclassified Corynebacterium TaxID=2624378 RepID=UPI00264DDA28|nr:2-succinyl-5-enolpyruvyl-6-hydroxy-3-cyclohexene-1-carboxylic-acid synthase [Corynebacterium sp.]
MTDLIDTPNHSGDNGSDHTGAAHLAPATRVAAVVVDALIANGVREAVVCPGSRSAPLALAFAEADRRHRLRLHVRTDERSASFLALGLAKRSGRAVPVVMTSGSAVANCMPAMVEATAAGVPLIVLSANRPWEMLGSGANQTIDQFGIFGSHAVEAVGIDAAVRGSEGDAQDAASADATVRDRVAHAVLHAMGPVGAGGVQVDVPFAEPLVPATTADVTLAATLAGSERSVPDRLRTPHDPAATVDLSLRTLVVTGDVRDRVWAQEVLDELAGVPTIAEPGSPAPDTPVHPAAAGLFAAEIGAGVGDGDYRAQMRPEQIVLVGRPTLHRGTARLLADPAIRVVPVSDRPTAPSVGRSDVDTAAPFRGVRVTGEHPRGWLRTCAAAGEVAATAVREEIAAGEFTGLHVAAAVTDSLSDGDAVVLGASSAVRDASLTGLPFPGVHVVTNRGAAGIDGTVSTAVGVALAHASAEPDLMRAPRTVALMGDLTFLHDVNGLSVGPGEPRPENLVIVVSNDDGGAIFETLEVGVPGLREFEDGVSAFDRVVGTPTGADLEALCDGYNVAHRRVTNINELALALEDHAEGAGGMLVVEAAVTRAPRERMHRQLTEKTTVTPATPAQEG